MRNFSSKLLSLLLCVSMVLSMMTVIVTATKPDDYSVVIFNENYNGDTAVESTDYNSGGVTTTIVNNTTATGLTGGGDKGDFIKVDFNTGVSNFFRMEYTSANPSALDKSGYQISDLKKMQVSFDICPTTIDKEFGIRFYDQFNSGTRADTLITFKNDGTIAFLGSEDTANYVANKWISFDLYFNFTGTSGTYDLYIDGEGVVSGAATENLCKCVEGFGSPTFTPASNYTYYLDNLRLAIPEAFAISSTYPTNEASDIAIDSDVTATFNYNLADVTNDMVSISGGTVPVEYEVSKDGKVLTVDITSGLEYNTPYTVTFKEHIASSDGDLLGADYPITFTTELNPEAPAPKPDDYSVEIFKEDFNGDTEVNSSDYNDTGITATVVNNTTATGLTGSEDKGDFAKIDFNSGTTNYFRIEYTGSNSALDKSGYQLTDLSKMQASFDICPTTIDKEIIFRFYDQFSSGSTKADSLVKFKNDGTIAYWNGTEFEDSGVNYVANKWMSVDIYFNFTGTSGTYDLYIDDVEMVSGAPTTNLVSCIESFGSNSFTPSSSYTYYLDNMRIAIPERFAISSTNPQNNASGIAIDSDIYATFNFDLADVTNDMVSISGGTMPVIYEVSKSGRVMTIDIQSELENNTPYTVIFKENIAALNGDTLGIDVPITFTTVAASLPPGTPTPKPNDYLEELYFEDFNGDTGINSTDIEINSGTGTNVEIVNTTTGIVGGEDKEDYAKVNLVVTNDSEGTNTTFRVMYGKTTAPVQRSGYSVAELNKMQMSFDICPTTTDKSYSIRFYDKFSNPSGTKGDSLIEFGNDGKITFMNDDTTVIPYVANKWLSFDVYLEFTGTSGKYSVYINDEAVAENLPTTNLIHCAESFGINAALARGTSYQVLMDNMRIATLKQFAIKETTPANGTEFVSINQDMTATFNSDLADVANNMVTVTGGTAPMTYNVSKDGAVLIVDFTSDLEYNTLYTITFKGNIAALNGDLLGEDKIVTFKTEEKVELTPSDLVDYNTVIYEEDFDGTAAINQSDFAITGATTSIMNNTTAPELAGSEDKGDFLNVKYTTGTGTNYLRLWYGGSTYPVQRAGYTVSQLGKMQASFDICPTSTDKNFTISFYDKFSSSDTLRDDLITFKNNGRIGFLNSTDEVSYTANQWIKIDVFFEFTGTSGVYSVVIDGNKVVDKKSTTKLVACFESFGSPTLGSVSADHTYYLDNLKILIPSKLEFKKTIPANNATGVNIADSIKFEFSNVLDSVDKELVTIEGVAPSEYEVSAVNNTLLVKFINGMELDKTYIVTVSKDIKDAYGQTFGTADKTVTFKTSAEEKIYTSAAEFSDKVTASVVNTTDTAETIALVLLIVDSDNKVTMYTDEQSVAVAGKSELSVDFDVADLAEGEKAYALIADGASTLNPVVDAYYTPDGVDNSTSTTIASVDLSKPTILYSIATAKGTVNTNEKRNLILKLMSSTGTLLAAYPVQTNENGAFEQNIELSDYGYGEYYISVVGYNVPECDEIKLVYMSNDEKTAIKNAINNAASALAMKTTLNLEEYKNKMNLDDKFLCDNVYTSLYEQRPYSTYEDVITMINKIDSVLNEINNADWSKYSDIFAENSDLVLKNSTKLSVYNSLNSNKKNEVNKLIVENKPFTSFKDLTAQFDNAVISYISSKNNNTVGGGAGGGGGGAGGAYGSSPSVTNPYEIVDAAQQITEENKNLIFTDLDTVVWAKESIYKLCDVGIISIDTEYRPLDNVKREEFVKMLVLLSGIAIDSNASSFIDVNGDEWYAPYLSAAKNAGIINGKEDGSFGVGENISRQDMVVMAQRTVTLMDKKIIQNNTIQDFSDKATISDYAKEAIGQMQAAGVVSGMGNGCFEPLGNANRAQAAVVICNLINAMI